MYDSGILTGRGQAVQDDFEKLEGATDTVDMLQRYHHPYLGGPRQMLNQIPMGIRFWPSGARPSCLEVLSAACLGRHFGQRWDAQCSRRIVFYN